MLEFILAIFVWYFSASFHEADISEMCKKDGIAKGLFVDIKCQEMKSEEINKQLKEKE